MVMVACLVSAYLNFVLKLVSAAPPKQLRSACAKQLADPSGLLQHYLSGGRDAFWCSCTVGPLDLLLDDACSVRLAAS